MSDDVRAEDLIVDPSASQDEGGPVVKSTRKKKKEGRRPYWFYTDSIDKGNYSWDGASDGEYNQFAVGHHYSFFKDTVLLANILNVTQSDVSKRHYDFLFHSVAHRKRWYPAENKKRGAIDRIDEISHFLQLSHARAVEFIGILTEGQYVDLIAKIDEGGRS